MEDGGVELENSETYLHNWKKAAKEKVEENLGMANGHKRL
jgi:hypothetical protein